MDHPGHNHRSHDDQNPRAPAGPVALPRQGGAMNRSIRRMTALAQGIVLVWLLPGAALAASPASRESPPAAAPEEPDELGEVVVSGEQPTRKVADLIPWIRRLLGQYTFEGHVDLGGKGE